jgi:hypothetical protein
MRVLLAVRLTLRVDLLLHVIPPRSRYRPLVLLLRVRRVRDRDAMRSPWGVFVVPVREKRGLIPD